MTHIALFNAIRSRFETEITDSLSIATQFDNAAFPKPGVTTNWIRFTIKLAGSDQKSMGASTNRFRTIGVAIAQVFVPLYKGDDAALSIADSIRTAFQAVTDTGVKFETPSVDPVGSNGGYWQVNVRCPFYADDLS